MPWLRIKRDPIFFHVYWWKIKKITQNVAKLAPTIRKASKKQRCRLQKRLYIGSNDSYWFDALIETWYKGFVSVFLLHDCRWKIKTTPHIGTNKLLLYIYELPNDNANLRKSESIFQTMSSSFACQFSILVTLLLTDLSVSPLADVLNLGTTFVSSSIWCIVT